MRCSNLGKWDIGFSVGIGCQPGNTRDWWGLNQWPGYSCRETVSKQWLLQLVSLELRKFGGVVLFDTKTEFNF